MLNNKGIAFFIVLALLFLLSIGTIAALLTAYNYANVSENQIRRLQAISAAEAGIHYAFWKIRVAKDDDNNDVDYGDGATHTLYPRISLPTDYSLDVDVAIDEDSLTGRKRIRSTVSYNKAEVLL